jgi:hypothetical protein
MTVGEPRQGRLLQAASRDSSLIDRPSLRIASRTRSDKEAAVFMPEA